MNDDDDLRTMFGEAAARAPVGPPPVTATMARGRRLRRRRTAMSAAVVAAVLCASAPALDLVGSGSSGSSPASERGPAASPSGPAPGARVVEPGERIDVGSGNTMWLTADGRYHFVEAGSMKSADQPVPEATSAAGVVDLRVYQTRKSILYTGAYRGNGDVAAVTVEVDGRVTYAHTVTLAGRPGWFAYHLNGADAGFPGKAGGEAKVTVRAADGTVLATALGAVPSPG